MSHGKKLVLIIDCGATSVRAAAVDERGRIVRIQARPNAARPQRADRPWLVWDLEDIWEKMLSCAAAVVHGTGRERFAAISVVTFSDDGAPFDRGGRMLYPVISWHCPRTAALAESVRARSDFSSIFRLCGEQPLHQHTLMRLLWLREHEPRVYERVHRYLMLPGIIHERLTGTAVNDPTTADSMMLMDIRKRAYSGDLMKTFGIDPGFFPPLVEPGTVTGRLLPAVAHAIGLAGPIPVVAAGHDTQFAVYGSGCAPGAAVLSSGTWEILFTRAARPLTGAGALRAGIKNECDAEPGLFNVGTQWIGGGVLERIKAGGVDDRTVREAATLPPGCRGLWFEPSLLPGPGNRGLPAGSVLGLDMRTSPAEVYRAALEGFSFTLRAALERIERSSSKKISGLTIVGGGSANSTWNRIRADVLDRPIVIAGQKESTVLGAAMFAFAGAGLYGSAGEARAAFDIRGAVVEPGAARDTYADLFGLYMERIESLRKAYRLSGHV